VNQGKGRETDGQVEKGEEEKYKTASESTKFKNRNIIYLSSMQATMCAWVGVSGANVPAR